MHTKLTKRFLIAAFVAMLCLGGFSLGSWVSAETSSTMSSGSTTCPDGSTAPMGSTCPSSSQTTQPTQSHDTQCTSGGGKLCPSASGGSSWCSYSSSPCPPYDDASCKAQSGEWCPGTNGGYGWCATNGATCPINDKVGCEAKSRNWCASTSSGGSGWCATSGSTCPAYDEASCKAQNSEWCTSSYGGSGWCASTPGSCPVNDEATCKAKSRSWCPGTSGGYGWCANVGSTCPGGDTGGGTYTCSDGSKVSDSSKCPSITYTMSWPSTEPECKKYQGVWCNSMYSGSYSSTYSGSCMMKGSSCPETTPSDKMRCWDDTLVPMSSSCPMSPISQSDCTAKSGQWCANMSSYSGSSSGYCMSKKHVCSKNPPSGKMVCPDNETFATKLTECPAVVDVVAKPTPEIKKKTCPDGSMVEETMACPKSEIYKVCPNGEKVLENTVCPEKKLDDSADACLKLKGIWCPKTTVGEAYCEFANKSCKVVGEKKELTPTQIKLIEQQKKTLLIKIEGIERIFQREGDQVSLAKSRVLKEKLLKLAVDSSAIETLQIIREEVSLLEDIKNELLNKDQGDTDEDRKMQEYALKELKKSIPVYTRQLLSIKTKIATLEQAKFTIPSGLKDAVDRGQKYIDVISKATSYEEAKDAVLAFGEEAYELNDWVPKLQQLVRLSGMTDLINKEITKREKELASVQSLAKKFKLDMDTYLSGVETDLQDARTAFRGLKEKDFSEVDPFDYVETRIIDKLENVDLVLVNARSLTGLKVAYNKLSASISSYEARIRRLEAKKQNTSEVRAILSEAKKNLAEIKPFTVQKIGSEDVEVIVEKLQAIYELTQQLNDLLQIKIQSTLQKELSRTAKPNESIQKLKVEDIEGKLLRAESISRFYRDPAIGTIPTLVAGIKIHRKK